MNHFLDWLRDSGTQAMLVLLGTTAAIVAAVAAIWALIYAKDAPTKNDLSRVEQNTAHLQEVRTGILSVDERMKRQEQADELRVRANGVSISVKGEAVVGQPLPVYLTTTEPTVHFVRVEFLSEQGNVFGTSDCIPTENLFEYIARLPSQQLQDWRHAGAPVTLSGTRHGLRVYMRFDDHTHTVYRHMAVTLTSATKAVPPIAVFRIDGNV